MNLTENFSSFEMHHKLWFITYDSLVGLYLGLKLFFKLKKFMNDWNKLPSAEFKEKMLMAAIKWQL